MVKTLLHETSRLALSEEDGWQYVTRKNSTGVVIMVAVTDAEELVLVEQYRIPVHARVLELPAGIAGDTDANEDFAAAANRELEEETGYRATTVTPLYEGSVSPGLVGEVLSFFRMEGLKKVGDGGGVDAEEDITVHHVPLAEAEAYFAGFRESGGMVDCKVYAGLYEALKRG